LVLTIPPATDSLWRDNVLNISYTVLGHDGEEVLVHCANGARSWTDALHISLFGSELTAV
jgi:hypothetical protein